MVVNATLVIHSRLEPFLGLYFILRNAHLKASFSLPNYKIFFNLKYREKTQRKEKEIKKSMLNYSPSISSYVS